MPLMPLFSPQRSIGSFRYAEAGAAKARYGLSVKGLYDRPGDWLEVGAGIGHEKISHQPSIALISLSRTNK